MSAIDKINKILENFDAIGNIDNEYTDVHDDIRVHVYYDEDGFVWDAIEGEYVIGTSDVAFDTLEEAEEDAKKFINSFAVIDKDEDYNPEKEDGEEVE